MFHDRMEAGRTLASELTPYANRDDVVVLGLPRGGVPVAFEVAKRLHAPLDILVVRKLGTPHYEELAMGAIASGGVRVLNENVVANLNISKHAIDEVTAREEGELLRRERAYRGGAPAVDVAHKTVILVDDGIATGATFAAALEALKRQNPAHIVIAVPVASISALDRFADQVDEMTVLTTPELFFAVGQVYDDFSAVEDTEVMRLMAAAQSARPVTGVKHAARSQA